uniref:Uncharacterized protein n=1 Tax=Setaria italica TaxID=4555 RepID=K3Y4L9_SETIT
MIVLFRNLLIGRRKPSQCMCAMVWISWPYEQVGLIPPHEYMG